ncbi:MAG: cation transporter [Ignavibacteriales bacterium]|nr:cation transporter [Ignavibacteriales bacterium]
MSHDHNHHHHIDGNYNNKFKIGVALNLAFVLIEFIFGILNDSLALIADAGHNLSDVIGLLIAWGASYLVLKKPTKNFTYGFKKSSILAAQINALILLVAIGIIIWEAVDRIKSPPEVNGEILMIVAGIGVIINGITTYLFLSGKDTDLNIKGAYLHMLADTLISLGVVLSGFIIYMTNISLIDPIISIVIAIIILWGTWGLLTEATKLSLDAVPQSIDLEKIRKYIQSISQINEIHDLHVWALSTTENALTIHIIVEKKENEDSLIKKINHHLKSEFNITHTTIQIEEIKCESGC